MTKIILKTSKGVTLIEIMFSLVILAIAALSASGLMSYGHRGTMADFRQGQALQILVDRLNFLSSLSFSTLKKSINEGKTLINGPFKGKSFGTVKINKNEYEVSARLKFQSVSFKCLKSLRLPNLPGYEAYNHNLPATWHFVNRTPSTSETFNATSGPYAYAVVKIAVTVCPIVRLKNSGIRRERPSSAITFICNTEGCQ